MTPTQTSGKSAGIEVNSQNLRLVALENETQITQRTVTSLDGAAAIVPQIAAVIAELRRAMPQLNAVGVAVPGLVNRQTNHVDLSRQFPALAQIDLAGELSRATGVRVALENDATAAAYGEYRLGAGRGASSLFFATIGNGIGGAIILDGQLWRGAVGFAGEFGHIAINEDGVRLEDVASAANIVRRAKERLYHDSTSSLSRRQLEEATTVYDLVEAANNGDDFAHLMIERTGKYIGTAIASVINLLNTERIVIGGEVMEAQRVILESIVRQAKERSFGLSFAATQIAAAELGADAAAIGAALLSQNE